MAEQISDTELEKWQFLEPALAELLGTHLPTAVGPVEENSDPRT